MDGINGTALLVPAGALHRVETGPGGPVYLLRQPAVHERAAWRREVARIGGRQVFPGDLVEAVGRGVVALLPDPDDPDRRRLLATVDDYRQRMAQAIELVRAHHFDPTVDLAPITALMTPGPAFETLAATVRQHWPDYALLQADAEAWPELAGIAAATLFLVGWEAGEPPVLPEFARSLGGAASEATLKAIPVHHLVLIGRAAEGLLVPGWRALGNLPSGRGPRPAPPPSSSTRTQHANGRRRKAGASSRSASPG